MKYKIKEETKIKSHDMSEDMINLFVKQIAHELHNYTLYKTFANYFGNEGFILFQEYYNLRADEELLHHNWLVDFLNERGVMFSYPSVAEVVEEINDYTTPFELTVNVEEETTRMIYEIVNLAQKEGDWITFSWLMQNNEKTGALVMEQLEEESISNLVLDIVTQDGSWLEKERSVMNAYKK